MTMKKIVCIGDSNTYGYDPRSYLADRYAKNVRWTGLLKEAGFEVINLGMNGVCIPKDGKTLLPLLAQYEPYDLCVIMLGSNDLLTGADAKETGQRMKAFLKDLADQNDRLLLVSPVPFRPRKWPHSSDTGQNENRRRHRRRFSLFEKEHAYYSSLVSRRIVTGPSLTLRTCISAPNSPVST